jgi:hypothetical protein
MALINIPTADQLGASLKANLLAALPQLQQSGVEAGKEILGNLVDQHVAQLAGSLEDQALSKLGEMGTGLAKQLTDYLDTHKIVISFEPKETK